VDSKKPISHYLIVIFHPKYNSIDENFEELEYGWFFITFRRLLIDFA